MLWTTAQCETLKEMWDQSVPEAQIIERLGIQVSPTAVRKKAWHLGLTRRLHSIEWTEERTNELLRLWSAGHTCSEIAVCFNDGTTRNAVIGKIHRLGLSDQDRARKIRVRPTKQVLSPEERKRRESERQLNRVRAPRRRGDADRSATQRIRKFIDKRERLPNGRLPPLVIVEATPADFLGIAFMDLEPGQCRYPRGEGPTVAFCGQPITRLAYCGDCYRLSCRRAA